MSARTVFQNACVLLDLVDLGTLIAYRDIITKYHARYGASCWLIIYQTDVRTRLEQLPRNCRRLASLQNAARAAGGTTSFTPARPWGHALQAAMDETNWWRQELEEPALLALTKAQALGQLIAGDAAVANMHPSRPSHHVMGAPSGAERAQSSAPPPAKKQRQGGRSLQENNQDANGRFTTNRQGLAICPGWQDGTCTHGNKCERGSHQCNICLNNAHGAKGHGKNGHGSGRGKGQGGGKKGGKHGGKGKY